MIKNLVLALLVFPLSSLAQTDTTLDAVTVTASLSPSRTSQTGRNVLVVRPERLQQLPVHSIDELLRYVPGIEVQSRGAMGTQSDIVMRGGTFQQVLVLVDGIRVNDPITGHFNSYIPVAYEEIERIEVLKGPAAALYGSDAVGGVIHVITKTFHQQDSIVKTMGGARYTRGENDLHSGQGGIYLQRKNWRLSAGALTNHSDGVQQRGTTSYFHNNTVSLSGGLVLRNGMRLSLRSAYDDRRFSAQNYYTTFLSDTAKEQVRTTWQQAALAYKKGRSSWNADLGYKATDDHYAFNSVATANENQSALWQAQARHMITTGSLLISTGMQWLQRGIASNDRGNHQETQLTGFTLWRWLVTEKFTVLPALRLDWHERRGLETIPQLSMSYALDHLTFRGSAGKTIRDADFTERYNNYNKAKVLSGRIGNPDLEAETALAYEAGIDYVTSKKLKVSASYFSRSHKGLIDYAPTPYADMPRKSNLVETGTYALAKNLSAVTIKGVELDLSYSWDLSHGTIITDLGLLWAEGHSKEGASSFYLSSFARFLGNFSASYQHRRFGISFTGLYKERKSQSASAISAKLSSDYLVVNGKAELNLLRDKAAIFVQADNIFDVAYSDLLGAEMPGRWLMGGLKFKF